METIEDILRSFDGKKHKIFDKNQNLTKKGYESYQKLINILYNVQCLVSHNMNLEKVITDLDKIIDEKVY